MTQVVHDPGQAWRELLMEMYTSGRAVKTVGTVGASNVIIEQAITCAYPSRILWCGLASSSAVIDWSCSV